MERIIILLHFLEIHVGYVAVLVACVVLALRRASVGGLSVASARLCIRILCVVHLLACGVEDGVQLADSRIDSCYVLVLVSRTELFESLLDRRFFVGG